MCSLGDFQVLLANSLSNDTVTRQNAEFIYGEMVEKNFYEVIDLHFLNIEDGANDPAQSLSAILVKQIMSSLDSDVLEEITSSFACSLMARISKLFYQEGYSGVFFSLISNMAAHVYIILCGTTDLSFFISNLFEIAKVGSDPIVIAAIDCLWQILDRSTKHYENHIEEAYQIISRGITNISNPNVILICLKFLYFLVLSRISLPSYFVEFHSHIPSVLQQLPDDLLGSALSDLAFIIRIKPSFFGEHISCLIEVLISIVSNQHPSQSRTLSMECIISIARDFGVGFTDYIRKSIEAFMIAAADVNESLIENEDQDLSVIETAEGSLHQLAELFGKRTSYPTSCIELINQFINSDYWPYRRAALVSLDVLMMVCSNALTKEINNIVPMLFDCFQDDMQIVRYTAYYAFSQASYDFGPQLEYDFHSDVMVYLPKAIRHETSGYLKSAALKALSRFCENCTIEILSHYCSDLIEIFLEMLDHEEAELQIAIMASISFLSQVTQQSFTEYYPFIMSWLKGIITEIRPENMDPLRSKAIETVPLVGLSVEEELFIPDASQILSVLSEDNWYAMCDNEFDATHNAISQLAKNYPDSFLSFSEKIMTNLYDIASQQLKYQVDPYIPPYHPSTNFPYKINEKENTVMIFNISQLQMIKASIETINTIIKSCGSTFFEETPEICTIAHQICGYSMYPDVQLVGINCLFNLLIHYLHFKEDCLNEFVSWLVDSLFEDILEDYPIRVLNPMILLLTKGIDLIPPQSPTYQSIPSTVISIIYSLLSASCERRESNNEKGLSNTVNSPESLEEDELVFSLGMLLRSCFQRFPQQLSQYYHSLSFQRETIFLLELMTDYIIYSPTSHQSHYESLLSTITDLINGQRVNEIRFAYVSYANLVLSGKITEPNIVLGIMTQARDCFIHYENEEDICYQLAIDGAIVAITACEKALEEYDENILKQWFRQLPMYKSIPESIYVYNFLLELVEEGNQSILEEDSMSHLLEVFSTILDDPNIDEEVKMRTQECIIALSTNESTKESFSNACSCLGKESRLTITKCLN